MTDVVVAVLLCAAVIVAPLAWRAWADRREARALQLRADINATDESIVANRIASALLVRLSV